MTACSEEKGALTFFRCGLASASVALDVKTSTLCRASSESRYVGEAVRVNG